MYYSMPTYGYGGCMPQYGCCNNNGNGKGGYSYALILVLFILLAIIGSAWFANRIFSHYEYMPC